MRVNILSMKQPEVEGHEDTRTTVFYISDAWRLPVQLPQQLPAVRLLLQMNLCKSISNEKWNRNSLALLIIQAEVVTLR